MEWSWTTWLVSVASVLASGLIAAVEGNWSRRPGLGMGFVNHGGMWGDLSLLPLANAVIVPWLDRGPWLAAATAAALIASVWVHGYWSRDAHTPNVRAANDDAAQQEIEQAAGDAASRQSQQTFDDERELTSSRRRVSRGDHMWPARVHGGWSRDLSIAGWAHVIYVAGELTLLAGFLLHPMPADVVLLVTAVFTIHVPMGLLQPRYFLTGHIATASEQPLLLPLLLALWGVSLVKVVGFDRLAG